MSATKTWWAMSATKTWRAMLADLLNDGSHVAPKSAGADFGGNESYEVLGYQSRWDMSRPAIACERRKLGYRFMLAEAACVLRGDNRLSSIRPFSEHMARFSDDGHTLSGHYGPPFVDQVAHVARTLIADPASRQAVMTLWRPRPGPTNDTPCTVALQWLVRQTVDQDDDPAIADRLHCVVTMRSSDAWTGVPYDVFTFSMMSAYLSLLIRDLQKKRALSGPAEHENDPIDPLPLGSLILTAGSQHVYAKDVAEASVCCRMYDSAVAFDPSPIDLRAYGGPDDLVERLLRGASGNRDTAIDFIRGRFS